MNKKKPVQTITNLSQSRPHSVVAQETISTQYYKRILLRKLLTIFRLENIPENWNEMYIWRAIYLNGWIAFAVTEIGIIPVNGAYSGYDHYGFPTVFQVSNPCLESSTHDIGKTAEIVYLENTSPIPDYGWINVRGIIDAFAQRLANCDSAIDVNLMNSKIAYVFSCEDNAQANTAKYMYDEITSGKPAVFVRKNQTEFLKSEGLVPFFNSVKNSFIAQEVQDLKREIMNEFLTLIGIDNAPVRKRERVQNAETESNNVEIVNAIADWEFNLQNGFDRVNKLFGYSVRVERNYKGVENGIQDDLQPVGNDGNRPDNI